MDSIDDTDLVFVVSYDTNENIIPHCGVWTLETWKIYFVNKIILQSVVIYSFDKSAKGWKKKYFQMSYYDTDGIL